MRSVMSCLGAPSVEVSQLLVADLPQDDEKKKKKKDFPMPLSVLGKSMLWEKLAVDMS